MPDHAVPARGTCPPRVAVSGPPRAPPGEVTRLLIQYGGGERAALDELMPLVYADLKQVARGRLAREPARPFDTTGLVHEAYMRLVDAGAMTIESRAHFLSIAARAMRRILIDDARRRRAAKRGGDQQPATLNDEIHGLPTRDERLIELDDALRSLAELNERQAEVVGLRVFGGLSVEEAATALGISAATAKRDWASARAWLNRELSG